MKSPSPPAPPDPLKTSAADQQGNTGTAIAQTWLKNANEVSPLGTVNYDRTGTQFTTDATGNKIEVPTFTKTTTLSPDEQANYDLQNQLGQQAGGIAGQQLDRVSESLANPVGVNLPDRASAAAPPQYQTLSNDNYGAYRDRAEAALRERMSPQLDRQREAANTALFNQGVRPGSEAYREGQALADRQRNDAELGIIGQAGGEVDRAYGMDLSRLQANNQVAGQSFSDAMNAAGFDNTSRQQALQEQMAISNLPINQATALASMNQVSMPQFQPYQSGNIAPTSVGDNIWKNYNAQMQNYQIESQNRNAQMAGIFGLGSSALRLPFMMGGLV
jgi:hypothetical protein